MVDPADTQAALRAALGYLFRDPALLTDALTHSSYKNEKPGLVRSDNERLEFLGDAVLQFMVSTLLWERYPSASAGEMTRRRADLVCEDALAGIARSVTLGAALRLGRGEERSGGRDKPRLLASALEAVVAAVYLDGGNSAALALCRTLFEQHLGGRSPGERDFKTRVQEMLQSRGHKPPTYEVQRESGPDHARNYVVAILVEGAPFARGEGRSKLEAEQAAAEQALQLLELAEPGSPTG